FTLLFEAFPAHPALHSFPTRRSSDLDVLLRAVTKPILIAPHVVVFVNNRCRRGWQLHAACHGICLYAQITGLRLDFIFIQGPFADRKSTRLNSSHVKISYAVFCLKKK